MSWQICQQHEKQLLGSRRLGVNRQEEVKCPCTVTWLCQMQGELEKENNLTLLLKILGPHSSKHLRMGLVPQRCCSDLWEEFAARAVEVCWQALLLRCTFSRADQWDMLCQQWNFLVLREAANTLPGIEGMCAASIHSFPGNTACSSFHFKTRDSFLGIKLILFMFPA